MEASTILQSAALLCAAPYLFITACGHTGRQLHRCSVCVPGDAVPPFKAFKGVSCVNIQGFPRGGVALIPGVALKRPFLSLRPRLRLLKSRRRPYSPIALTLADVILKDVRVQCANSLSGNLIISGDVLV